MQTCCWEEVPCLICNKNQHLLTAEGGREMLNHCFQSASI